MPDQTSARHTAGYLPRFLRFALVGASGVVVNNGLLWLLAELTSLPFYLCSLIAIESSIVSNFLLNDRYTWHDRRSGSVLARMLRYNASTACSSIAVNMTVLLFLKKWVGIPYLPANLVGIGCGMLANYAANSVWTYGSTRVALPRAAWVILGVSLAVRLAVAAGLGAGFDEAYYYAYAVHPSMSYFDHPPMVGFLAGFVPSLTGLANSLTIRLAAVVLFSVTSLLVYALARKKGTRREAVGALAVFSATPLFLLGAGTMILPDAGLALFWTCALVLVSTLFSRDRTRLIDWCALGAVIGLCMLSKYHGGMALVSVWLYALLFRRREFLRPGPYLCAVVALAVFSPVIIWNAQQDFVSFLFQGGRAAGGRFSAMRFLRALGGQAAYVTPILLVPFAWAAWCSVRRGLFFRDAAWQRALLFGTFPVAVFLGIAFMRPILPHWTLPGYIILCVPVGAMAARWFTAGRWFRLMVFAALVLEAGLLTVAYLHTAYGVLPLERMAARGWVEDKVVARDATLDVHGWEEVPAYLDRQGLSPDSTFLFTHRWFLSGEVCLAVQNRYQVACFSHDPRGFGVWDAAHDRTGMDGLCVSTSRYRVDVHQRYGEYFADIGPTDSVVVTRGGIPAKTLYFTPCRFLLRPYPIPF